ncbi:hypothetical protein BU24DRAFT_423755 [Aaosphaeria arxii CBS 175.79]|uniref:Uncharacterized protein n=1 Tax=Aaosphaeria arxii CBS 175.79 TaxID=1450172 RepID=A0A6A5XPH4_9PLEO|nr:uncharacterized protein BU24DRAFT_423755 [Aaosphaeria arxii CBS 175.79]KAF2014843.1 hypothetical protein BU24DRAFT_423755 [Aaosphaeria arxii CBS 175.79]
MNTRTAAIAALAITIFGALYFVTTAPAGSSFHMSSSSSSSATTVPGIEFKLSQISRSPPSILVTLKNHSPSSTYTLLKWGTPLDPLAQNLGVFKLNNADTGEEVSIDIIKISRKMPPPRDALVTIMPGTEESTEVIFDKPWMPNTKPAKYNVRAEGRFMGIWEKSADEVTDDELDDYSAGPLNGRLFKTEEVLMLVQ